MDMKTWTKSAIRNYYLDPAVRFLEIGPRDNGATPIARAGYYIAPHCDPDCCQAIDGVARVDLGPFLTANAARKWSVRNLASID
jgi:hypothetical protein